MKDKFRNFQELASYYRNEVDYRIQPVDRSGSIIVLAIHAGGIEPGTSEVARAIAGTDFSLYLFEGLAKRNQTLHITSTNFDEPRCLEMVMKHHTSLSLHGFHETRTDPPIYLGGNDVTLIQHLLDTLIKNGYPARTNTAGFAARNPENVCNRTISGRGVQMEISAKLRSGFFEDYSTRKGRIHTTTRFSHFVQLVRQVLLDY